MSHPHPRSRVHRGFTLIELLTVIAIIGILAAIIIPTVSKVRTTAKNAQCVAQLREWGRVIQLYANDNKGCYYAKNWPSVATKDAPNGRTYLSYFSSNSASMEGYRMRYCPSDPDTARILTSTTPNSDPRYLMVVGSINGNIATQPSESPSAPPAIPLSKATSPSQYLLMLDSVVVNDKGLSSTGFALKGNDLASMQTYVAPLSTGTDQQRHGTKFNALFGDGSVKRVTWNTTPTDKTSVFSMRNVWFQLY